MNLRFTPGWYALTRCTRTPYVKSSVTCWTQVRTLFFTPTKIKYNDSAVVHYPQSLLYDIVADVDQYHRFIPNCFESTVLERRSPSLMRAKLVVGIPRVISADFFSTVHLTKPDRILTRSDENKFTRYLESEWRFEPSTSRGKEDPHRTLAKFRVEFELHSALTANLLNVVFDDFARKTMEAFLIRAELLHRRRQQELNRTDDNLRKR